MNIRVNWNGLIGAMLVIAMITIRYLQVGGESFLVRLLAAILDLYVLLAIVPYVVGLFVLTRRRASRRFTQKYRTSDDRMNLFRLLVGSHIAFVLLVIGLLLGLNDFLTRFLYFIVALAIGLGAPFLLLQSTDDKSKSTSEV